MRGIIAPILTPFEDDGTIDRDLWSAHAGWLLRQGAHYLSPFGTTGEALSVSMSERMAALEWLIEDGISAERLVPGTGLTALADTRELTQHALSNGCAATMVLPSFFFTAAGEDGHVRYYSELIETIADPALKVVLYNIPQNTGVPVTPSLAARLARAFPDTVVGYKDSSADWSNTLAVIEAAPGLAVFPGSESFLTQGLANGAAGCISATVNLNAAAIREVYDGHRSGRNVEAEDAAIKVFRKTVQDAGLIPAMKAMLALRSEDARWLNLRPPLENATHELGEALLAALGGMAAHIGAPDDHTAALALAPRADAPSAISRSAASPLPVTLRPHDDR